MAENKTQITTASVQKFINTIEPESKRHDAEQLLQIFTMITGKEAKMWGTSIIGFGQYHYKYTSNREGDFLITGFAPRKQNISIYIMHGFAKVADLLLSLGKHKTGKSCLYINSLSDIDEKTLSNIIRLSFEQMQKTYDCS